MTSDQARAAIEALPTLAHRGVPEFCLGRPAVLAILADLALDATAVGRIIDEHYRARLAADPTGPRIHECGTYCGADIAARGFALAAPPPSPES